MLANYTCLERTISTFMHNLISSISWYKPATDTRAYYFIILAFAFFYLIMFYFVYDYLALILIWTIVSDNPLRYWQYFRIFKLTNYCGNEEDPPRWSSRQGFMSGRRVFPEHKYNIFNIKHPGYLPIKAMIYVLVLVFLTLIPLLSFSKYSWKSRLNCNKNYTSCFRE